MSAAPGLRAELVRGRRSDELDSELLAFWDAHGALPPGAARARLEQVVCVLRDGEGGLAAVGSVIEEDVPELGGRRFWIYRTLAPTAAARAALDHMVLLARRRLEKERTGRSGEPLGICVRITDRGVMERRNEPVWPVSGLTFLGYTAAGAQLRVIYFEDAKIV